MSIEELLKPRYKVIAEDTSKKFCLGDVLIKEQERGQFILRHANRDIVYMITEKNIVKYPHLFKKLEWWEERKESEMPEYVKSKSGRVYEVYKYFTIGGFQRLDTMESYSLKNYLPATEEEYIQYQQNKNVCQ